jgi:hypothetical protein
MSLVSGKDVLIKFYDATVSDYVVVGCGRSVTFEISREMVETSITSGGTFKTWVPGAAEVSGTIEGFVFLQDTITDKLDMGRLYDLIYDGTRISITYYETDQSGNYYLQKDLLGYITSINETASFDNINTFSLSFKGTSSPNISYGEI